MSLKDDTWTVEITLGENRWESLLGSSHQVILVLKPICFGVGLSHGCTGFLEDVVVVVVATGIVHFPR